MTERTRQSAALARRLGHDAALVAPDALRSAVRELVERFRPDEALGLRATWVVATTDGLAYTVTVRDGRCLVSVGAAEAWDARLEADTATWIDLFAGRADGIAAFMGGRLRVAGDLHLALRLETLFTPGPETTRLVRTTHTEVQGVTIESLVAGHGPRVLLLHGLGANKLTFVPTIDRLSRDHEVHALDLPGFGKSSKPLPHGRRYAPAWMAAIVHGYMVRNGIREAYLVGNSMGGRIATELALRHPRRVRGIVNLGAAVALDEWQRFGRLVGLAQWQWAGIVSLPLRASWVESHLSRTLLHDPTSIPEANLRAGAEDVLRSARGVGYRLAVAACARHLAAERAKGRRGYWQRLEELHVPSHWVWGRQDQLVSCDYAERVREALPAATVEVWDDVGHVPQFEAPERTVDTIASFVERVERGF